MKLRADRFEAQLTEVQKQEIEDSIGRLGYSRTKQLIIVRLGVSVSQSTLNRFLQRRRAETPDLRTDLIEIRQHLENLTRKVSNLVSAAL